MARYRRSLVKSAIFSSCSIVGIASFAGSCSAQASANVTPPAGSTLSTSDVGPDIVITAQKRSERLYSTPQSVTVLKSADLLDQGATKLSDFADRVPGLSFQTSGAGQNQVTLRGVTAGFDVSPTVGIYVDDVPYGATQFGKGASLALDMGLFDLDRIEVLRGPQGTLYGASTMGGLIKYVTMQPDSSKLSVEARGGISATEHGGLGYNAAAAINVPVSKDKIALRVSGFYNHDAGFIDDLGLGRKDVNRARTYGARADLLLTPTERLSIRVTGFGQNINREGPDAADFNLDGTPVDGSLDQRRLIPEPFRQRFWLVSGTVSYNIDWATLESITSYQKTRTSITTDLSSLYLPFFPDSGYGSIGFLDRLRTSKLTEEFRITSKSGVPLEWILGAYYDHEKTGELGNFLLADSSGASLPNDLYSASDPSAYTEIAAFGDLTYHITDKFDVTAGIRYSHNHQYTLQFGSGILTSDLPRRNSSDSTPTYLANLRYRPNSRTMLYARFATGYRPGGPQAIANDPVTLQPLGPVTFAPDRLKSYEGGAKWQSSDHAVGIDVSAYHIDWNNIQIVAASNGISFIANAPKARVNGAELSVTGRPFPQFTILGTLAYQDAKLAEADAFLGGSRGERLPNVPKFTAALNADYRSDSLPLRPSFGGTVRYVSDRFTSFDQSPFVPQYRLPPYVAVDLRGGFDFGRVTASLYVRNLLDKRGQYLSQSPAPSLTGPVTIAIIQPRTVGFSLSTRY